jgi:hypothetical protein
MAHVWASAGKGCMMKVVRTRIVVALASSAVAASGFGLTAFAASATSQVTVSASQSVTQLAPNTTVIDYGAHN